MTASPRLHRVLVALRHRAFISAAAIATVAAACHGTASPASNATSAPREGYVATSDSVRLFYRVVGQGPDTLIAIHGGPGVDLESIYGDFLVLAARHVVIFYDQRGTG
ncbi:MAG: hypothetical protein HY275_06225, partial [Gemmatimonadetes bacterium]|nr:hypothetical protein [Gemmatimonadota bacterium]